MKILVVNDDGYQAEGLKILIEVLKDFGELYVIAPKEHHSGKSNAITIQKALHTKEIKLPFVKKAYYVKGFPADCARISSALFSDVKFDLLVSGINEGANVGSNIMHSGTIGAAVEGLHLNIPAIAVSSPVGNYYNAKNYTKSLIKTILKHKLESHLYVLNINFPENDTKPQGVYFSHQSVNYQPNTFIKKGNKYLPVYKRKEDHDTNSDVYGYFNNFITITPILRVKNDDKVLKELKEKSVNFNI